MFSWFLSKVKGYVVIIIGLLLIAFGLISMIKINNSESYSLKFIIAGCMFVAFGVARYVLK
jgi:membrane protein CcdC involved in cytochrome C biogenesis